MSSHEINVTNEQSQKSTCERIFDNIKNWFKSFMTKNDTIMPAKEAYCKSTYGEMTDATKLINKHQQRINRIIKDRTQYRTSGDNAFADYRCVYSFPKDAIPYIDNVLGIFRNLGYTVINLSDKVDEIKDDNVYMISWYKENIEQ